MNASQNTTHATPPCGIFNAFNCTDGEMDDEDRYLALVVLALACALCVLCMLIFVMGILVYKLSDIWMSALVIKATEGDGVDARKGLLHTIKGSIGPKCKSRKGALAEDTSCAPARDVDEEDL